MDSLPGQQELHVTPILKVIWSCECVCRRKGVSREGKLLSVQLLETVFSWLAEEGNSNWVARENSLHFLAWLLTDCTLNSGED